MGKLTVRWNAGCRTAFMPGRVGDYGGIQEVKNRHNLKEGDVKSHIEVYYHASQIKEKIS